MVVSKKKSNFIVVKRVKTTKMNIWVLSCWFCSLYLFFTMKPIKIIVNKSQHTMHCLMEEKHWLHMLIPDWTIFYKTLCARSVLWPVHKLQTKTISLCLRGVIRWFPTSFRFSSYIQEQHFTINHQIFYFLLQSWLYLQ